MFTLKDQHKVRTQLDKSFSLKEIPMKKLFMASMLLGAFLVQSNLAQTPTGNMQTFGGCGLVGDAQTQPLENLNRLKNRYTPPTASEMNPQVTLDAILAPGNDLNRWNESLGAEITGYVVAVKPGGPETVNCHAKDPAHTDTHIELALNPGDTENIKHMIVEVTPRGRAIMAAKGTDWSTANLQRTLIGKRVKVTGWMMIDRQHCNASENTHPGDPSNWRATCWEIHPVSGLAAASTP
jgi:hypothetical protein